MDWRSFFIGYHCKTSLLEYAVLDQMVDTPEEQKAVKDGPREMLTLQECTEVIKGVSAHAIRVLIAKGEIQALRVGESSRARILVPKDSLLAYFDRL